MPAIAFLPVKPSQAHESCALPLQDDRQAAWPSAAQPLTNLLKGKAGRASPAAQAAGSGEDLQAAGSAALQRLWSRQLGIDPDNPGKQLPAEASLDSAAVLYCCWCATSYQLLAGTREQQQQQPGQGQQRGQRIRAALAALRTALRGYPAGIPGVQQLVQQEAAGLLLLAGAAGGEAHAEAGTVALLFKDASKQLAQQQQQPLLWPPTQQPGEVDPLVAVALTPPPADVVPLPAAVLLRQLPLRLQVLLLEALLPACSSRAAVAATAIAQQAAEAAAAERSAAGPQAQERAPLWRFPVLSWALPAAASALASSTPPAAPELWSQASAANACVMGRDVPIAPFLFWSMIPPPHG